MRTRGHHDSPRLHSAPARDLTREEIPRGETTRRKATPRRRRDVFAPPPLSFPPFHSPPLSFPLRLFLFRGHFDRSRRHLGVRFFASSTVTSCHRARAPRSRSLAYFPPRIRALFFPIRSATISRRYSSSSHLPPPCLAILRPESPSRREQRQHEERQKQRGRERETEREIRTKHVVPPHVITSDDVISAFFLVVPPTPGSSTNGSRC